VCVSSWLEALTYCNFTFVVNIPEAEEVTNLVTTVFTLSLLLRLSYNFQRLYIPPDISKHCGEHAWWWEWGNSTFLISFNV